MGVSTDNDKPSSPLVSKDNESLCSSVAESHETCFLFIISKRNKFLYIIQAYKLNTSEFLALLSTSTLNTLSLITSETAQKNVEGLSLPSTLSYLY